MPDAGGDPCPAMREKVVSLQQEAQKCDPNGIKVQCADEVESFCCPIVVASKESAATASYLAALDDYKMKCRELCPLVACRIGPGVCLSAVGGAEGTCVRRNNLPPPP
jgi:hypothetical protein